MSDNLIVIPRSLLVYDSGPIMKCVRNDVRPSGGGEVHLIGNDSRFKPNRQTDYAAVQLILRDDAVLLFPVRETDLMRKRFRIILIEEAPIEYAPPAKPVPVDAP